VRVWTSRPAALSARSKVTPARSLLWRSPRRRPHRFGQLDKTYASGTCPGRYRSASQGTLAWWRSGGHPGWQPNRFGQLDRRFASGPRAWPPRALELRAGLGEVEAVAVTVDGGKVVGAGATPRERLGPRDAASTHVCGARVGIRKPRRFRCRSLRTERVVSAAGTMPYVSGASRAAISSALCRSGQLRVCGGYHPDSLHRSW